MDFFEFRNENWHQSDEGDWYIAAFDVDVPDKVLLKLEQGIDLSTFEREDMDRRIEKGFQQCVRDWLSMRGREGWVPTTRPFLRPGLFFIPDDPAALGKRRMYIAARWKREVPELLTIDDAAGFASVGYVDQEAQMREFFDQMGALSRAPIAQIERHMRETLAAPARAAKERAAIAESDYKDTHRISGVRYNRTR